eukprot:5858235-Pyramimonas_sp.AAC.1
MRHARFPFALQPVSRACSAPASASAQQRPFARATPVPVPVPSAPLDPQPEEAEHTMDELFEADEAVANDFF